jgi:PAS domain S-box-containing protein
VLELATEGLTDRAITIRLGISTGTLNTYWSRIRKKLGEFSRVELATHLVAARSEKQLDGLRAENILLIQSLDRGHASGQQELGSLAQFSQVIQAVPDVLLIVNQDGKICLANEVAENFLGYEPTTLAGVHIRVLIPERFHGWHAQKRQEFSNETNRRLMGRDGATIIRRKDGVEVPGVMAMNAVETNEGRVAVCTFRPSCETPIRG